MPRLTARRRLDIMTRALALAEDRSAAGLESVAADEVAAELGVSLDDVRASLEPLRWVEMRIPGDFVDLVDAIEVDDDRLVVRTGWWRRLAAFAPAEAARLYVRAAEAAAVDPGHSRELRTAMAKLRRMVGGVTVVEGNAPFIVEQLRAAQQDDALLMLDVEGHDRTVATSAVTFGVVAVYREGAEWMVTLYSPGGHRDLELEDGEATTIPVSKIVAAIPAGERSDHSTGGEAPSVVGGEPGTTTVVIEYPIELDWMLDPYAVKTFADTDDGKRRAELAVWGIPELRTLMLRLGPGSRIVAPEGLGSLQSETAAAILELYEAD